MRRSARLLELRSLAFYGDEEAGRPASDLFGRKDAERAMAWLDEMLGLYRELVTEESDDSA